MNAIANVVGDEVIGLPSQHLSQQELYALVRLADGNPTPIVAQEMSLDAIGMRQVETAIMAKLAAKNKVHMITRGFTLGVLIPQALSLLLCLAAVIESHQDFTRPKSQRRARTAAEVTRTLRLYSLSAGIGSGHYYTDLISTLFLDSSAQPVLNHSKAS